MERPSGLGRSLEDVLDSLTPADPNPSAPGRVLFEPEDIEQQLDSLMGEIRELRDRVQHLVALVPEGPSRAGPEKAKHKGAKKKSKHAKKPGKGAKVKGVKKSAKVKGAKHPHRAAA